MNIRSLLIASGIAGAVMALLSNLPVLYLGNCLACLWLWTSGIFGAWLYSRNEGSTTPGQGAVIGVLGGLIGAVIGAILGTIFGGAGLANLLGSQAGTSEELFGNVAGSYTLAGTFSFLGLLINVFIYPLFGAIGGAIGGVIFRQKTTA
jgi:hypothetical protein